MKRENFEETNVKLISWVTRRLVSGPDEAFTNKIASLLGIKIFPKKSDGHYIALKGTPEKNRIAESLLRELDQQAALAETNEAIKKVKQVKPHHYDMMRLHFDRLIAAHVAKHSEADEPKDAPAGQQQAAPLPDPANDAPRAEAGAAAAFGSVARPSSKAAAPKIRLLHPFKPLNVSQAIGYLAMKDDDVSVVFMVGPAGGGKSYVPAYYAIEASNAGKFEKILLFRPRTVTGKKDLGALKGDAKQKMAFYVKAFSNKVAEITGEPLAKIRNIEAWTPDGERGETYRNAVVVVDEAQNLTESEATMLLTRMGTGTKLIINGDISNNQNDLRGQYPGLAHLLATQAGAANDRDAALAKGMAFVQFTEDDSAARHPLMPNILKAFNTVAPEYQALLATIRKTSQDGVLATAIEAATRYAQATLETAARRTHGRYEQKAKAAYPDLFGMGAPSNVVQLGQRVLKA